MTTAHVSNRIDPLQGHSVICTGFCSIFAVVAIRSLFTLDSLWGLSALTVTLLFTVIAFIIFALVTALSLHHVRCLGHFAWMGLIALPSVFAIPALWPILLTCSILGPLFAIRYTVAFWQSEKSTWNTFRALPSLASACVGIALSVFAVIVAIEGKLFDAPWITSNQWYAFFVVAYVLFAWYRFGRVALEWILGTAFETMYKVDGRGPGLAEFPRVGPSIIIANHAGFFDPVVLEVILPRPVTGMMTSLYFDRWFVKPLAKYVFRIIRVPSVTIRHEAPELRDAIAALDRGESILIFPEAWLRRKEEMPLRRFGQGVWQLLCERPNTPVIACWIEGTWGSYFSHKNGPPMTGKPFDFRLPIQIGVSRPIQVPQKLLADHWDTRFYLMNEVSQARAHIGLEPLPPFTRANTDSEES